MLEKLKISFVKIKNEITPHVLVFDEPERGVEIEFVFGGEYPVEEWARVLGDLKKKRPDLFNSLESIIKEANSRSQKERAELVDTLTAPTKGILITKADEIRRESKRMYEQFLININSMSASNLANMQTAVDGLEEID